MTLISIVLLSLFTWGVSALFEEGMILGSVGQWLEANVHKNILKPTIWCPACMSGLYGMVVSYYFGYSIEDTVILILCTCGLNFIIMKHLQR